ncbi:MAG: FIVAR domain-containing protein [Solobacterium sp.]|nr:FIVAR domain-containing protein [Solobacterium sp.]
MKSETISKIIQEKQLEKETFENQLYELTHRRGFILSKKKKLTELEKSISDLDAEISELQDQYNNELQFEEIKQKKKEMQLQKAKSMASTAKKYSVHAISTLGVAVIASVIFLMNKPLTVNGNRTTYRAQVNMFENTPVNNEDYTPKTLAQFEEALEEAAGQKNNLLMSDEEKTEYLESVQEAFDTLEKKPDKHELNKMIQYAVNYDKSSYTPASVKVFENVISDLQKIYTDENATQKDVTDAEKQVQGAYLELVKKGDKTNLQQIIQAMVEYDTADYTPASVEAFDQEIAEIKKVNSDINASQDDVTRAEQLAEPAYQLLVKRADKTTLLGLYNSDSEYSLDRFTPKSIKKYNDVLASVKPVLEDENVSQEEVDTQVEVLQSIKDLLVVKANTDTLNYLVTSYSQLDENNYKSGYKELQSTVGSVKWLLNDGDVTQEEVDSAVAKLQDAGNSLVRYTTGIYRINMYAGIQSNNHVGNDWGYQRYYNGNAVYNGVEVSGTPGSAATVAMQIVENDSYPDVGSGSTTIYLNDGFQSSFYVYITENMGRYKGNSATFLVTVDVTLLRRE